MCNMLPAKELRKLLFKSNDVREFQAKVEISGTSFSTLYDKSSVSSEIKL